MSNHTSRRTFLYTTTLGASGAWLVGCQSIDAPRARRVSPNEKLHIAGVGVGGKGAGDVSSTAVNNHVVALCDVDDNTLSGSLAKYPGAKTYNDWRRMLEQKDIDAVTVSTPDHMHAPVAMAAMQLGKHVYVQKPMSHTIYEARQLTAAARRHGVVSQMGNQNHSGPGYRTVVKAVQNGVIGKVKEAHAWSNRPIWPQGQTRPTGNDPAPKHLHWDLWLGVAPYRPFVDGKDDGKGKRARGPYHPFNWRGYLDWGVGALGDMGCHIIDPVFWSLGLAAPARVWSEGPVTNGETFPEWEIIRYEFPATRYTAGNGVTMTWHDGGKRPADALFPGVEKAKIPTNGCLFIGEKATLLCEHGRTPVLLGDAAGTTLEAVPGDDHYQQWANACKGNGVATGSFDYSGPLTETVLLGTIAVRYPNQKLDWDSSKLKITNVAGANQFVHKKYRAGWEVKGLTT
ncbi:MAG: Gfo/Idh/MocA family oxidoreductase [Rhodobacteraceae bacterium]|nr:Gfo/Idh/MocA family oxidoreductase [Paracoccaceae bacterium]